MVKELKVVKLRDPEEELINRKNLKIISNTILYTTIFILFIEIAKRIV